MRRRYQMSSFPFSKSLFCFLYLQIRPVIEQVYPFKELSEAYANVEKGHNRGKTVVDMSTITGHIMLGLLTYL